jgi:CRP-like cAMP-binding protein
MEGDEPEFIGMVRSGSLHIVRDDFWGNRTIVARIAPPSLFAEALSAGGIKESPVSVVAAEDSEIVQINPLTITGICPRACPFHNRLVRNMAGLLAKKNITLMNKIELLTLPNTRLKLMTYLSDIAKTEKNDTVIIPFDRQGLADYLSVERSAMSAELCRMRDEGLLEFRKNRFRILRKE